MAEEALLRVRLTPRGGRAALMKREGDTLYARVAPPPVDGAANEALIALLSDALKISKSRIQFKSGETRRDKTLRIEGMSQTELERQIAIALNLP